jgi:hypothetical protein
MTPSFTVDEGWIQTNQRNTNIHQDLTIRYNNGYPQYIDIMQSRTDTPWSDKKPKLENRYREKFDATDMGFSDIIRMDVRKYLLEFEPTIGSFYA